MATPEEAQKSAVSAADRSAALAALKLAVARNKVAAMSLMEPAAKEEEDKHEPAEGNSRIIRLPDWYIMRIQKRGVRRPNPLLEDFLDRNPRFRETLLPSINASIDLEEDVLKQLNEKGYAEVGVEVVDSVSKLCILPKPDSHPTEEARSTTHDS